MHHTKDKGDIAAAKAIADLVDKGYSVFTPVVCEHLPFDLIAYKDGQCYRIQAKYNSNGAVKNKTSWTDKNGCHEKKYKTGDFDFYALYLPDINKVIYPSIKFGGCKIRTTPPKSPSPFYWWEDFDKSLVKKSANYHLISKGLVYPTFYSKLYPDIRQQLTLATEESRQAHKGLWQVDQTNTGFVLETLETITDKIVILPKLFRRLLSYLAINDGSVSLEGFSDYLKSMDDRLIILKEGHVTGFDFVVEVDGQNLKLNYQPEDLVFIEK